MVLPTSMSVHEIQCGSLLHFFMVNSCYKKSGHHGKLVLRLAHRGGQRFVSTWSATSLCRQEPSIKHSSRLTKLLSNPSTTPSNRIATPYQRRCAVCLIRLVNHTTPISKTTCRVPDQACENALPSRRCGPYERPDRVCKLGVCGGVEQSRTNKFA